MDDTSETPNSDAVSLGPADERPGRQGGTSAMTPARALLAEVVGDADLFASFSDTHLLAHSGVNSGDLVRLMLVLEERLDRPLTVEEVHRLVTIADIDALLVAHGTASVADPDPARATSR